MRVVASALLLVSACASIRSRDPANWLELQSQHFTLQTDLPPEDARSAIADLETLRDGLRAAGWHAGHESPSRIVVVALASEKELREFIPEEIAGYARQDAFGNQLILVNAGRTLLDSKLVKHELTHVLIHELLVTNPRWVQEGLAWYFETLEIDRAKGEVTRGDTDWRVLRYLKDYPPDTINWSLQVMGLGAAYDSYDPFRYELLSWVLVRWLIDNEPERFDRFLASLAHGESMWSSFNSLFPELTERRVAQVLHDLLLHPSRLRSARLPLPPASWKGDVAERKMPAADMHALRAMLLGGLSSRKGQGEERLRRIDAELALAKAADAANPLLLLMTGADPRPATVAHPDDWRAWLADFLKNPKEVSTIEKAAAIAPDNPMALSLLAASEQEAGKTAEAIRDAEKAVQLLPDYRWLHILAGIYDANGRCEEAAQQEERALDAVPDRVNRTVPEELRASLGHIVDGCRKRRTGAAPLVAEHPVLRGCRQWLPVRRGAERGIDAQFTIREDGSVTAVAVSGTGGDRIAGLVREFVQSCSFQPVLVQGTPRRAEAVLPLAALLGH